VRPVRFILLVTALFLASCRSTPEWPKTTPATGANYKKVVEDRLGPLWCHEVKNNLSAAQVGVVKLTFEIPAAGGHVTNLKVVSNTGGKIDEHIAVTAVNRLRAPPIPQAILESEKSDYLKFEESFTIFEDSSPTPTPIPPNREGDACLTTGQQFASATRRRRCAARDPSNRSS
jgi:hypothetical protein